MLYFHVGRYLETSQGGLSKYIYSFNTSVYFSSTLTGDEDQKCSAHRGRNTVLPFVLSHF